MTSSEFSFRPIRRLVNTLNLCIITRDYDQVPDLLNSILPQMHEFIEDNIMVSRVLVNFDFHGLFSYLFQMEKTDSNLDNIIYFLSIACQAQFFDPKNIMNRQNLLLIFSLFMRCSANHKIMMILLSILCKLTTPYSLSYLLFSNNNLFQPTIKLKNYFPISHILYNIVLSAFHDEYELEKKYSSIILQSSLQTLQSQENFYDDERFYFEEISFSLKLFGIYLEHSTFPIDFNINVLLEHRNLYLSGPEIIQEGFLDFLLSFESLGVEILNEITNFILNDNMNLSLKALKILKKSVFEQDDDDDDISFDDEEEEEEEEAKKDEGSISLFEIPDLVQIIPQLYQNESNVIQDEAFQLVVELCRIRMIDSDIFKILLSRLNDDYLFLIDVIAGLMDDFHSSTEDQIGQLNIKEFFEILDEHYDDLKKILSMKSTREKQINKLLISQICEAIDSYKKHTTEK